MALGFDEMNHCQVSLPWGGRSSRETSPEPHSSRSKPQANLPIMVVGLPGEALPLERQESIWLLCLLPGRVESVLFLPVGLKMPLICFARA